MNNEIKQQMTNRIQQFHLPAYEEIPDVGLYLEQTTQYITALLMPLEGITLTSSMISNYVKKKIIVNPIKKQYHREQIAYLIFIAIAKSILSLENIHRLMAMQKELCNIELAYNYFRTKFETILHQIFRVNGETFVMNTDDSDEKMILRNTIITAAHKIYLDNYCSLLK